MGKEKTKTKTVDVKNVRKIPRCSDCGLRIRGKNHEDGDHHNRRVPKNGGRR